MMILSDVFYSKDKGIQSHNGIKLTFSQNHVGNLLNKENATGIIKNYSWNYEKEVRIIIRFKNEQYSSQYNLLDNIYLEFPEEIKKTFKITKGPNFTEGSDENNENMQKTLKSINEAFNSNLKLEKSSYDKLIHFKSDDMVSPKD